MPARKPTALKKLSGTYRPYRENANEPTPSMPAGVPNPPCWLSPTASDIWCDLAPKLFETRCLTGSDLHSLANLANALAVVQECAATIAKDGMLVQSSRSAPRPHPALRMMKEFSQLAKILSVEFGLTPASRGRLNVPPQKSAEELEEERKWDDFINDR